MENRLSDKAALIFRDLEEELLEIVIKRLKKGTNNKKDLTQWQFEKLQDLGLINLQTIQKVTAATQLLEEEVEEAFRVGPDTVLQQVDRASQQKYKEPNTNIEQIVKGYLGRAKNDLNLTDEGLALWTYGSFDITQKYRGIIERSASFVNTGIHTLEQAVERAAHEILTEGLKTTMRDRKGRNIAVDSYVRTVLKTNLGQTMDEVRKEHMEDYGMHHVVVGSLVGAREACSKIQGQVVDLRPMDEIPEGSEYRSIHDPYWEAHYKEAGGHHGINCRHPHFPFIPGVNTNNQPQYDEELNRQVSEDQQKQRSLERQIRNYKKHLKIAQEFGNQEDINRYTKLISGRQKALRGLLDGHEYLSRDYNRERAFDFSPSPPKDIVKPKVPKKVPEPEPEPEVVTSFSPPTLEELDIHVKMLEESLLYERDVHEETAEAFEEMMKEMFEAHDPAMRISIRNLKEITETHFKNQFETGTSGGFLDEDVRKKATADLFGLDKEDILSLENEDFEKYGYLADSSLKADLTDSDARQYGGVVVRFKKENVMDRTTFTIGDSLAQARDGVIAASRVTNPSIAAVGDTQIGDMFEGEMGQKTIEELKGTIGNVQQFNKQAKVPYVELQFHGDLSMDDVESIAVPKYSLEERKLTPEIRQMLEDKGVKILIVE